MPLAIVLALMVSILSGFLLSANTEQATETAFIAQSNAIAGNMLGLRDYVIATARAPLPDGTVPNFMIFKSYTGLASAFLASIPVDQRDKTMDWFKQMPGVDAWMDHGDITVFYVPTTTQGEQASAGVQSALIQLSGEDMSVGKAISN